VTYWIFFMCTLSTECHTPLPFSFLACIALLSGLIKKFAFWVMALRSHLTPYQWLLKATNISPGKGYFMFENWGTVNGSFPLWHALSLWPWPCAYKGWDFKDNWLNWKNALLAESGLTGSLVSSWSYCVLIMMGLGYFDT